MRKLFFFGVLLSLLSLSPSVATLRAQNQTDLTPEQAAEVEALLASLSLEQKAGQLFMVTLYGRGITETAIDFITDYHPGAVAMFGFNTDYEAAGYVTGLINDWQNIATTTGAGIPLIVAADQEGGQVIRIVNGVTRFPDPIGMGAVDDPAIIRAVGRLTAEQLREIGINMNLAPVADLATRDDLLNPSRVMHRRSWGDDPNRVGLQTAAYVEGLAEGGMIGVLKHFPGHGGAGDSHRELPIIRTEAEEALNGPLHSFEVAISEGIPAVMVGHLYYEALDPDEVRPASLSPVMINILREDFGFEGVIMTDAMDMGGISISVPEASLAALQAGVDMIVMGPNVSWGSQRASVGRVIDAVLTGEMSEDQLDEHVRRVLSLKARYGLLEWTAPNPSTTEQRINLDSSPVLLALYQNAATLVRDRNNLLPLDPENERIAFTFPARYQGLLRACRELEPNLNYIGYTFNPPVDEINGAGGMGRQHDKVVMVLENLHENLAQLDFALALNPENTIIISLGSPYDLDRLPNISTAIALYSSLPESHSAACHALLGDIPFVGRTPVALNDHPSGTGIQINLGD